MLMHADILVGVRDGISEAFELVWRPQVCVPGECACRWPAGLLVSTGLCTPVGPCWLLLVTLVVCLDTGYPAGSCVQAKVSVFDSAFMLGDGVWEGIRCHR
jgi:hypothetical protein